MENKILELLKNLDVQHNAEDIRFYIMSGVEPDSIISKLKYEGETITQNDAEIILKCGLIYKEYTNDGFYMAHIESFEEWRETYQRLADY